MAAIQDGEEHVDEVDFSHKRLAALRVALLAGRRSGGRRLLWLATRGGVLRPDGGGCKQDCRRQNSRDEGVSTLHGGKNYRYARSAASIRLSGWTSAAESWCKKSVRSWGRAVSASCHQPGLSGCGQ